MRHSVLCKREEPKKRLSLSERKPKKERKERGKSDSLHLSMTCRHSFGPSLSPFLYRHLPLDMSCNPNSLIVLLSLSLSLSCSLSLCSIFLSLLLFPLTQPSVQFCVLVVEVTRKESVSANQDGKESNVRFDRPIVKFQIAIPGESVSMDHVTVKQGSKGPIVKSKIVSIHPVRIVVFVSKENASVNLDSEGSIVPVPMTDSSSSFLIAPSMVSMMLILPNALASMAILVIIVPLVSILFSSFTQQLPYTDFVHFVLRDSLFA